MEKISEKAATVCDLIVVGNSVEKACAAARYNPRYFYEELSKSEKLHKEYMHARETRAHARFESVENTIIDMRMGKIDAQQAKVELDAIKWQTSKERGKIYGDSTILRGDKENPLDIGLAALLEAASTKRQVIQHEESLPVIEGESQREIQSAALATFTESEPQREVARRVKRVEDLI